MLFIPEVQSLDVAIRQIAHIRPRDDAFRLKYNRSFLIVYTEYFYHKLPSAARSRQRTRVSRSKALCRGSLLPVLENISYSMPGAD